MSHASACKGSLKKRKSSKLFSFSTLFFVDQYVDNVVEFYYNLMLSDTTMWSDLDESEILYLSHDTCLLPNVVPWLKLITSSGLHHSSYLIYTMPIMFDNYIHSTWAKTTLYHEITPILYLKYWDCIEDCFKGKRLGYFIL